jgi:hypothetical protein
VGLLGGLDQHYLVFASARFARADVEQHLAAWISNLSEEATTEC